MGWIKETFTSTLGRKLIMALTGLFLIIFLVVHLSGNLLLLKEDGGEVFNAYTQFMTTNPFIKTISYALYLFILIHALLSLGLSVHNKKSRPVGYAVNSGSSNSTWRSRNMGLLGTVILIFLIIHMRSYWYVMKFGDIPMVEYAETGKMKDLYTIVQASFTQWWYVAIYVLSMIGLGFHLAHGFWSAFQTLGLNHQKYTPFIKKLGIAFAIIVPALFAYIPIRMFIDSLG